MPVAVNDIVTLKIEKLVNGGDGLGHLDQLAVFVPRTAPQDVVKVQITRRKKNFARAELLEVVSPSSCRVTPPCPFFLNGCGGCQWLHLDYAAQLEIKTALVAESIRHALKSNLVDIPAILPMSNPVHYRNKATVKCALAGSKTLELGFFARQSHQVVDIFAQSKGTCLALSEGNNSFLTECVTALQGHLSWLRKRKVTSIAVRSAHFADRGQPARISTNLPEFIFAGRKKIVELVADQVIIHCGRRDFQVTGNSFFQTNTRQTEILLQVIEKFLLLDPPGNVLADLFSGVGLFSLSFAEFFDRVYGVESSASAVRDARFNGEAQGVNNVSWIAGRAEDEFATLAATLPQLDTVIIDPPRQGCDRRLLTHLVSSRAQKIIYVSCDLATLCRDFKLLAAGGFQALAVQPVDMFPHTYHIECVALLIKNLP
jgi:23S rRNA (uracil1939-C5)-methyltransferase